MIITPLVRSLNTTSYKFADQNHRSILVKCLNPGSEPGVLFLLFEMNLHSRFSPLIPAVRRDVSSLGLVMTHYFVGTPRTSQPPTQRSIPAEIAQGAVLLLGPVRR